MAGLMTIVLGFLLMLLTPGAARAASAADMDFAARCGGAPTDGSGPGANGVLRCFGFDSASQLPRTLGAGTYECWGCDYGVMANNGNPNVPVIDTTIKASGGGAMRQLTPGGSGSSGAGYWFTHFGVGKTHQLNTGDEIYIQYRYRTDPAALNPALWPGGGGFKQDIVSLGDLPACGPGTYGLSSICTVTCQTATLVTQNAYQRGNVTMYANCAGPQPYTAPNSVDGAGTLWTQPAFSGGCPYPGPYTEPKCVVYHPNEWMTFKKYIKMGTFNNFDTVMKLWAGREGQPLQLIYHCGPGAPRVCNYGHDGGVNGSNGWLFYGATLCDGNGQNCNPASAYHMGKVYLLSYQTCEDSTKCGSGYPGSPDTNIWYDELIISTKDIADPGASATPPQTPSSPTSLRVSGFFAAPSASALCGLCLVLLIMAVLPRNGLSVSGVERKLQARQRALACRRLVARGAQAVSTLRRFRLTLLLVLALGVASPGMVQAACTGSTLPTLASNMAANEWCQLVTINGTGQQDVMGTAGENGSSSSDYITQFANSAAWDPIGQKFQFIGAAHGCCYVGRHVVFTASDTTWRIAPWPGGCSSAPPGQACFDHAYDHNTVDPATGDVYWRHYGDNLTVRRGTNQGTTWSTLPNVPASQGQCCLVVKYFPERNGLIWIDPDWGAFLYTPSTNQWTRIADTSQNQTGLVDLIGMGVASTNLTGMYSPGKHVFIVGGNSTVWKLDGTGVWTHLVDAPVSLGINNTSLATDPVSGDFVVMKNGSSTMWRLNPQGTGSWSTISATIPAALLSMLGPGDGLVNAAITNYGVIMYVKYTGSSTQTWLFKLAPSGGDLRAPRAPTGLNAG